MPGPGLVEHEITLTADGEMSWATDDNLQALSMQVEGDFGSGVVHLLASNDDQHYHPLPNHGARSFSTCGVKSLLREDTAFLYFKMRLEGSINPNITIKCVERKS